MNVRRCNMYESRLDPIGGLLVTSYLETLAFSRQFASDHDGRPPTLMAKVHHLRSVVGAQVHSDDRYELGEEYVDYGRIAITEVETGDCYVLRSEAATAIEKNRNQLRLFDVPNYIHTAETLLVHRFHKKGVNLSVVGARRLPGRSHLEAIGDPTFVGTWPFAGAGGPGSAPLGKSFDQGLADPFTELGIVDELGEESES